LSGWGFCSQLAADPRLADIPIAIITAVPPYRGVPHRRMDAGIFRKPLDLDALLACVSETLARARAEKTKETVAATQVESAGTAPEQTEAEIH